MCCHGSWIDKGWMWVLGNEFILYVYSTSSVIFFSYVHVNVYALHSHVSIFLISNRALAFPSSEEGKLKRKSLIEIHTHSIPTPHIDSPASDTNWVNIFPMIRFKIVFFQKTWSMNNVHDAISLCLVLQQGRNAKWKQYLRDFLIWFR